METRYPDYNQINQIRQRTLDWLYQNGRSINPTIVDFINALSQVPGFACEYLPEDHIFRVYTTEECNAHMVNIHMNIIGNLNRSFGNYDWYLAGACNFTMNSFLLPVQGGGIWLPVWEARTLSMEQGSATVAFSRAWADGIYNYLRSQGFIR